MIRGEFARFPRHAQRDAEGNQVIRIGKGIRVLGDESASDSEAALMIEIVGVRPEAVVPRGKSFTRLSIFRHG
jgi:hypothetical protein